MKRALEERFNRRVFTTVDTLKFLRTKYAACNPKTLDYDLHDLLSLRSVFNVCYDLKSNASQTDIKLPFGIDRVGTTGNFISFCDALDFT